MKIIDLGDMKVSYSDSQEIRDAVFDAVINFYKEQESFNGESICQNDGPIINAHLAFSKIADQIIKFDVEYVD